LDYALSSTVTAEDHFRRGRDSLACGAVAEALEHFRTAHQIDRENPRYRSYYGLAIGIVERRFDRALELCRSAAKEEFFNPDLYHNLARVHLAFGFKAEAIRYLRRGLMIDPANAAMHEDLRTLGTRSRPPLGFLPRRHPLNRVVGQLRRWWSQRGGPAEASA
jgi:tetratricopeptide (TPR) repeat protein